MKTLKMEYILENDKVLTHTLRDPQEGLTRAAVEAVMTEFITKKAICVSGFFAKAIKDAFIYETDKHALA